MLKLIERHLFTDFKKKPFYQKPYFYLVLGIIFLALAGLCYFYDIPYKSWVSSSIAIRHNNTINLIFDTIKPLGKYIVTVFLALIIGGIGLKKTCYKFFAAFVIMSTIIWCLKVSVHRERPNKIDHHSFPSGDTGTATVLLVAAASDIPILAPIAVVTVPAVAFLRTYDNFHHLSDVLAGIGIGIISVGLAHFITFRHNMLANLIKSRHLALLAVLLAIALLVKRDPNYIDFLAFCVPSLFLLLLTPYLSILPRSGNKKMLLPVKTIFQFFAIKNITSLHIRNISYILAVLSVIIFALAWVHCDNDARISISGLAMIPISYLIIKEKMIASKKLKTASYLSFLAFIILSIFTFIAMLIRTL